jgi:CBS domain-containing protein
MSPSEVDRTAGVPAANSDAGVSEIARFLAEQAPFDVLAPQELAEVVAQTELEFYRAGAVILSEDGGPVTFLRVILSGAVDISHNDQLLDLLGAGDMFGHSAMLAGLPPGFQARAAEDTLCYRVPVAVARPLLDRAASREVRVGVHEPAHQPVAELIRTQTVQCDPEQTIGDVARAMTEAQAGAAVVNLQDGTIAIVTDRDLRTYALAAGLDAGAPVRVAMRTPALTVTPDRLGGDVLFEMLERGVHHAPVVTESGRLIGVVEDVDLFAVQPRSWFGARRAIARASDADALAALADGLADVVVDLHASGLRAVEVARVLSALVDGLVSRALDLTLTSEGIPPDGMVWLALGSHARRELTPASRRTGVLLYSDQPGAGAVEQARALLARCGVTVAAVQSASVPSGAVEVGNDWQSDDDTQLELLIDRRAVWGTPLHSLPAPSDLARDRLVPLLAKRALAHTLPTGFEADTVLGPHGGRSDRLDVRASALTPIVDLARWAGVEADCWQGSTPSRLLAAGARDALTESEASTLADAFELVFELRARHHVGQLADGQDPDDLLEAATVGTLARGQLRDVFRAVSAVQRRHRA